MGSSKFKVCGRLAAALIIHFALCALHFELSFAQAPDTTVTRLLNEGYDLRRAGQTEQAVERFRRATAADTTHHRAALELGFALLALERRDEAREVFARVVLIAPNDAPSWLQLGYLHQAAGDLRGARLAFERAGEVGEGEVRERALAAARVIAAMRSGERGTPFLEVYAAPLYQSRFDNFIAAGHLRVGAVLASSPRLEGYALVRFARDTRSRAGEQPQIFSDNVASVGVGARMRVPGTPVTAYGELAGSRSFGVSRLGGRADHRAGALAWHAWPGGEASLDASYYHRFENGILYALARQMVGAATGSARTFRPYFQAGLVADTRGEFYNNVGEGGVGLLLSPAGPAGARIHAQYVRGWYLRDPPASRTYGDVRVVAGLAATR